jgi:glycosyltransferase involved in cell wall biosynthesis
MIGQKGVPATVGGIERHVEELGARFVDLGHDVTVFCRRSYSTERPREYRGMRLRHLPTVATKHLDALAGALLASVVATRGFDVVHYHALGPGLAAPIPRYVSRAAVVQTVHGLDDERGKWGAGASRGLRLAQTMSARVPDETIVVSKALQQHYRTTHRRETEYVPNGVAVRETGADVRALERFGVTDRGYVLFVGRLVPEKAVDLLIRAFRRVPGDTRLVVAGPSSFSDSYVAELERLARLDPRVVLPGAVIGDELAALYRHAGAFVLPSLLEGLPLTLLEAASFGVPVVISDIPPHREVCGREGPGVAIVPTGDESALTAALTAVLRNGDEARADADALRRHVVDAYSWDGAALATLDVYDRAVARLRKS